MSDQVPTTFQVTFQNNMRLALQQTQPLVWPLLDERGGPGDELKQLDDIIGHVKSMKGSNDGRHGDTQYANTGHSRLFCAKPDFDYYAELVDNNDQVQTKIALTSAYMQTGRATINRARDDAVIAGFFGNMLTGSYQGPTAVPFPSGNVIGSDVGGVPATATGMNIAKLAAAKKMLAEQYNDPNEVAYMVVTADDTDQLLKEMPVTSKDFGAEGGELRDGKLRRLMGFTFIEMETENPLFHNASLVDAGSGNRKTPFWKKSGLVRVPWWDLITDIGPLRHKHLSIQIYASTCGAATRTDSGKVGYILNKKQ
ncbi:MAG TPA: phage capsid protein [Allosphingosinicella sp.]|nr:phage capsid protein [Allosphingosinicella sp.]